jgi:hypothetical protein
MNCLLLLGRWNRGFEFHWRHGCLVCMLLFCVCDVLCLGRGLATSWSLVQGILPSVEETNYGTEWKDWALNDLEEPLKKNICITYTRPLSVQTQYSSLLLLIRNCTLKMHGLSNLRAVEVNSWLSHVRNTCFSLKMWNLRKALHIHHFWLLTVFYLHPFPPGRCYVAPLNFVTVFSLAHKSFQWYGLIYVASVFTNGINRFISALNNEEFKTS